MAAVRAVTFDAAGTLFAPAEPVAVTYAGSAARHGITLLAGDLEPHLQAAFASAPPLAFGDLAPTARAERERSWWRDLVRRTFGTAGDHPAFEACFADLFAHYGQADAWRVFPEVADTLRRLRARGLRLAVVSNFDGRLPGVLAGLEVAPLVDAVLYSTAVGVAKPAARIFDAAARALAASRHEIVHVGDEIDTDVTGALAAGFRAVLVDRTGRRPPLPRGAQAVTTLADLTTLIE